MIVQVHYATALDWFIICSFGYCMATLLEFAGVHYFTKVERIRMIQIEHCNDNDVQKKDADDCIKDKNYGNGFAEDANDDDEFIKVDNHDDEVVKADTADVQVGSGEAMFQDDAEDEVAAAESEEWMDVEDWEQDTGPPPRR